MKLNILMRVLFCLSFFACEAKNDDRFIFFLHNKFLENHELNESHPKYGRTQYNEVITEFEKNGFKVISEKRNRDTDIKEYAVGIVNQIDSLIKKGIEPKKITVIGTSKGGYIAQIVSTLANNQDLNFIFIACFRDNDIQNFTEINYCGNILTIYEKSDPYGVSALERKKMSSCEIKNFKEIELNTGMGHGFFFKPLKEWIKPAVKWASGNYSVE